MGEHPLAREYRLSGGHTQNVPADLLPPHLLPLADVVDRLFRALLVSEMCSGCRYEESCQSRRDLLGGGA